MNSAKFKLVKSVDCCFDSFTVFKATCHKVFRASFKDTRQRPQIFSFLNLLLCTLCVLTFRFHNFGYNKRTPSIYLWVFTISIAVSWIMGFLLMYSYTKRKHILCKVWCVAEVIVMFTLLYLTLSETVHVSWPGCTLLGFTFVIKLYGLWVIYYFSLEVENSPDRRYEEEDDDDRSRAKYVAKRSLTKRRDTDQTSIASPPPSPGNFEEDENLDECGDSVLDDNSPTAASILFFQNENMYNHDTHDSHRPYSINSTASKDNIIISDLMCGGSSLLNVNTEVQG